MTMQALFGKEATITLREKSATLHGPFASITPKTYDLRGVVMRRPHWDKDSDNFALAIKFTDVPLRIINIRNVVAVNGKKMIQPKKKEPDQVFRVKASKGDGEYLVKVSNGYWTCNCVANSSFRKICRHIKEIKGE
jgi:hypothetical protein